VQVNTLMSIYLKATTRGWILGPQCCSVFPINNKMELEKILNSCMIENTVRLLTLTDSERKLKVFFSYMCKTKDFNRKMWKQHYYVLWN
jgi:hypothetical protein